MIAGRFEGTFDPPVATARLQDIRICRLIRRCDRGSLYRRIAAAAPAPRHDRGAYALNDELTDS